MIRLRPVLLAFAFVAVSACVDAAPASTPAPQSETAATASPSETASPTGPATVAPTTPAPPPSLPALDDLGAFVRVLVPSWRPGGSTVLIERRPGVGNGQIITAVPLGGGAPVDLVALTSDGGDWDVRRDGSAIVTTVDSYCTGGACAPRKPRLASIDLVSGTARWLTADDPAQDQGSPRWSDDDLSIIYGTTDARATDRVDLGIFRVRADGTGRTRLTEPVSPMPAAFGQRYSSARPQRLTSDGLLLWIATTGDRSSLRVRDLTTGAERAFASTVECVGLAALRTAAPAALVLEGGCHVPASRLVRWDVRSGAQSVLVDFPSITYGADWDPSGARVVAAIVSDLASGRSQLVVIDGSQRTLIRDTDGAASVRSLASGIIYTTISTPSSTDCVFGTSDLRFIPNAGAAKTIYSACALGRFIPVGLGS